MTGTMKNIIFIDGQNFYLSAKKAFNLRFPDFDIPRLGTFLSDQIDPVNETETRFYIGMPSSRYSPQWTRFWNNKIDDARDRGVEITTRELRYLTETDPQSPNGFRVLSAREKGIDLRIGLDVLAAARRRDCANIMIVSRDQDFQEVVSDVSTMCDFTGRDIGLWSAYPVVPDNGPLNRGIDGTREFEVTRKIYDGLRDTKDHRKSRPRREVGSPAGPG